MADPDKAYCFVKVVDACQAHFEPSDASPSSHNLCLTGHPCGTRLGPGEPGSSKSSSQSKKPISMLAMK